jgi:hypothetical protein
MSAAGWTGMCNTNPREVEMIMVVESVVLIITYLILAIFLGKRTWAHCQKQRANRRVARRAKIIAQHQATSSLNRSNPSFPPLLPNYDSIENMYADIQLPSFGAPIPEVQMSLQFPVNPQVMGGIYQRAQEGLRPPAARPGYLREISTARVGIEPTTTQARVRAPTPPPIMQDYVRA